MKRSEWIERNIPEWVQVFAAAVIFLFIAILIIYAVGAAGDITRRAPVASPRPEIYILQEFDYQTMEGAETYVLDYAMNGEVQAEAIFPTVKQRDEFKAYLDKYGKIVSGK